MGKDNQFCKENIPIKIILYGTPISTNVVYRRHGNIIYMSAEGKGLKQIYQMQAKAQYRKELIYKLLKIEIWLYFKDNRRRDWDNWHKLSMDSLTGIVWEDDSQIKDSHVKMFIDKNNPRIELTISKL